MKSKLPSRGIICEDYRRNLSLINREAKALNAFNNEDYVSPSNLKSIFSGIQSSSYFNAPNMITFFNEDLDGAQKKAVTKALNSQDIALIQGPPGTGKTNVIIEILTQILEMNRQGHIFKQKILLVSQAHAAVDKMLEDLDRTSNDNSKVIRIGRDENLSDMVKEKYAVDYAQSRWVDKIIENSNKFAQKLLYSLNIDKEDFDKYCEAIMETEFSKEKDEKGYEDAKSFVTYFEEKYKEHLDTKDFKSLKIQRDWDKENFEEEFVSVPEQGGGKLIPGGMGKPGHVYLVGHGETGMIGVFKIETEVVPGSGKFERTGLGSNREAKENINTAFNYFKANKKNISGSISVQNFDYLMHVQDLQGIGITAELSLAAFIAMCSGALKKPVQSQMVVLGSMSIGGTIKKVEELASTLKVCFDAGAKKVLIPWLQQQQI